MKKVILDTNFLLIPSQFRVDIFSELERACNFSYQTCVLEGTVEELDRIITNQSGKNRAAAKLALALIKSKKVKILKSEGNVDKALIELSKKDAIVATQDQVLRRQLKGKKLVLRQKKYLQLI